MSGLSSAARVWLVGHVRGALHSRATFDAVLCASEPGAWSVAGGALYDAIAACPPPALAGTGLRPLLLGRTMFESDRVPSGWRARLNALDAVLVPTAWQARVFADGGVDPAKLRVLGEGVDTKLFHPAGPRERERAPPFVFLSVGKNEARKRFPLLLDAFEREFSLAEREQGAVQLRIVSAGLTLPRRIAGVSVLDQHVPQTDFPQLYRDADAFVLPSAGEGWGRPTAEAMASRLPVIVTGWGGSTEFANDRTAFLLDYEMEEIEQGAFKGHQWAKPKIADLRAKMRLVFSDADARNQRAEEGYRSIVQNYSSKEIGRQLRAILHELVDSHREKVAPLKSEL